LAVAYYKVLCGSQLAVAYYKVLCGSRLDELSSLVLNMPRAALLIRRMTRISN